jgi:hypothetical protein
MSLTDRLEKFFRAHPGMWIDGMELARFAGSYAWRTRASELRTQRGMAIKNRVRVVGGRKVSEYQFVPVGQMTLLEGS